MDNIADVKKARGMKTMGIILIVIATIILLAGIISPVNVIVCSLISVLLFVIGVYVIRRQR